MEAAVEVEVVTGYCNGDDVDLELDDDELSIGAEVTCDDSDGNGGGVSILEELLKAQNGNGEALACLQVNARSMRYRVHLFMGQPVKVSTITEQFITLYYKGRFLRPSCLNEQCPLKDLAFTTGYSFIVKRVTHRV